MENFSKKEYELLDNALNKFVGGEIINTENFKLNFLPQHILPMAVLSKLEKDGYLMCCDAPDIKPMYPSYRITFEGLIFSKNKGYSEEWRRNNNEQMEIRTHRWILTIGSIIAALYSISQFICRIYHHFPVK